MCFYLRKFVCNVSCALKGLSKSMLESGGDVAV